MPPRKQVPTGPQPLKTIRATCPFSGDRLEFVETSAGYQVRGKGWVSTKLYTDLDVARWVFSHNEGVAPSFPNPFTRVQVGEEKAPPLPEAADAAEAADKMGQDMGAEALKDFEKGQK